MGGILSGPFHRTIRNSTDGSESGEDNGGIVVSGGNAVVVGTADVGVGVGVDAKSPRILISDSSLRLLTLVEKRSDFFEEEEEEDEEKNVIDTDDGNTIR